MIPKKQHLQPTPIIDSEHASVQSFTYHHAGRSNNMTDRAIRLFYAVRDEIRYNPYLYNLTFNDQKASVTLEKKESWCVPKAVLLAACCRAIGIPARLGFADVRNHLSTKRLREEMQTDVFSWHGYTIIFLNGKWVKATPAFNGELCKKFRLKPLDFDGHHDSIYHPFDLNGNKHMEYIQLRGEYDDVPLKEMRQSVMEQYGKTSFKTKGSVFEDDVDREFLPNHEREAAS